MIVILYHHHQFTSITKWNELGLEVNLVGKLAY